MQLCNMHDTIYSKPPIMRIYGELLQLSYNFIRTFFNVALGYNTALIIQIKILVIHI